MGVFWRQGDNATSMKDLAAATRLRAAGIPGFHLYHKPRPGAQGRREFVNRPSAAPGVLPQGKRHTNASFRCRY
jgi:hypothetical protein